MLGAFYIWQRDLRLFRKFWFFALVLEANMLLLLLAFGPAMTRLLPRFAYPGGRPNIQIDYFTFFLPGLVVLVVAQMGLGLGDLNYRDRETGMLEIVFTAPLSRWSICLGKLASATTIATVVAGTLYAVSFIIGFHPYNTLIGTLVLLGIVIVCCWGFVGLSIAGVMQNFTSAR